MSLPNGVRITRDGIEFENNVDATQYTLNELTRAALRDCGKLICSRTKKRIRKRTGRGKKSVQYWARSKQENPDLLVGYKPQGFYIGLQELGTSKCPKTDYLFNTVNESIDDMQEIQAHYLSGISLPTPPDISEEDYEGGDEDE